MSGAVWAAGDRISVTRHGAVSEIRLTRGARGNAIDLSTAEAFAAAVAHVVTDPETTVVLLTAVGRNFCVGGDVVEFGRDPDPSALVRRTTSAMHPAVLTLATSHKPVITAAHGAVSGAGLAFVLVADVAVAADDTVFAAGYLGLGVAPDCGVSQLLPVKVGPARALDLLLMGRRVSAHEALDWGLVSRVCPAPPGNSDGAGVLESEEPAAADQLARQLATTLAGEPPEAVAETLRLIAIGDLEQGLPAESDSIVKLISSPAASVRIARFAVPSRTD